MYFWEFLRVQKCLRKLKMDKKNVQFWKTQGFYQTRIFQKVNLHQNALIFKKTEKNGLP